MATAFDVAEYIIKSLPVDNLKLQKLLYYSQAVHLVRYGGSPLFGEDIEAWDYGPVVPPVYKQYKPHGFDIIRPPAEETRTCLQPEQMRSVVMALACFGEMSGTALINQTHRESPWKNAYRPGLPSRVITLESIYDFFHKNLEFTEDEFET